jgi:hypothetical protein
MRSPAQRKADAIGKLEGDLDVWVATGDEDGGAHLVPLSLCWHAGQVVVAVSAASRTGRNAARSGRARLALGTSRDVVMVDATAAVVPQTEADPDLVAVYRTRTGWDPGEEDGEWTYVLLRPQRIQVWCDVAEIPGRTVMRGGVWLA